MRHPRRKSFGPKSPGTKSPGTKSPGTKSRGIILVFTLVTAGLLAALPSTAHSTQQDQEVSETEQKQATPTRRDQLTEIYEVKHARVEDLSSLIRIFTVVPNANPDLGVIGLRGAPEDVRAALEALRRLDVPPEPSPSVEITLWILLGSKEPNGDALPEALRPVARQLEGTLGYAAFELLDTVLVRTRDGGRVATGGTFQAAGSLSVPANYGMDILSAEIVPGEGDNGATVRLRQLEFVLYPQLDEEQTGRPTALQTDVDVRESQKVVVGKATTSPDNRGLILVLEARVEVP